LFVFGGCETVPMAEHVGLNVSIMYKYLPKARWEILNWGIEEIDASFTLPLILLELLNQERYDRLTVSLG
jgi:hypothetical protein